jgi:hypothetical protein
MSSMSPNYPGRRQVSRPGASLPRCKKAVGEGAKQTLSMGNARITSGAKGVDDGGVAWL